jgi:membrane protein YdbS with pleckstrin-like domain
MMPINEKLAGARAQWQKFEHVIILVLTALIAVVVVPLGLCSVSSRVRDDPHGHPLRSNSRDAVGRCGASLWRRARVRSAILIALLAIVRKFLILDFAKTDQELLGLSAAILALGVVHWLVRDQDQREAVNEGPFGNRSA